MMTVKEHYDLHLGNFYAWMAGDFTISQQEQEENFRRWSLHPKQTGVAIDLGAGHGLQAVSLANLGYSVVAIDFNSQLLSELCSRTKHLQVEVVNEDLREVKNFADRSPEVVLCCGDTIAHLSSKEEIQRLIEDVYNVLLVKGKFLITFRDYSEALTGTSRFIPVKSDDTRIASCFLEYEVEKLNVTDIFFEKVGSAWVQKVSTYQKVRITTSMLKDYLLESGFSILKEETSARMVCLLAQK